VSKVIVYHSGYGCDTGCCGHIVEIDGKGKFFFAHPWDGDESFRDWAEELIRENFGDEHVADLDWAHSLVVDD
jgi:hypothetical protein